MHAWLISVITGYNPHDLFITNLTSIRSKIIIAYIAVGLKLWVPSGEAAMKPGLPLSCLLLIIPALPTAACPE